MAQRRFHFGKNWQSYAAKALTPARIRQAVAAFERLFDGIELEGRSFLDIGFGQGLTAAIAAIKGCDVLAMDIDPDNLQALELTKKAFRLERDIKTQIASILDDSFVAGWKGHFDVVHSWGVLHHTGDMNTAIANACQMVKKGGYLVLAIYNRHWSCPFWKAIKYVYNLCPSPIQTMMVLVFYPVVYTAKYLVTGKNPREKDRGMDFYHDLVDWIGGYPYQYASVEEVCQMIEGWGFRCIRVRPASVPTGCNEYVFFKDQG